MTSTSLGDGTDFDRARTSMQSKRITIRIGFLGLTLFATLLTPSHAETETAGGLPLSDGDVVCYDYDSPSHSCAATAKARTATGSGATFAVELHLSDGVDAIRFDLVFSDTVTEGQRCILHETVNAAITPKDLPYSRLVETIVVGTFKQYARNNLCATYRKCGNAFVEQAWLKGERRADWDSLVWHFPANDPSLEGLSLRTIFAGDEFSDAPPGECYPSM